MIGRDCSLHIGTTYNDDGGKYARALEEHARLRGLRTRLLVDTDAICGNVVGEIRAAAAVLQPGDVFLITFTGHGAWRDDKKGDEADEADGRDELWCLADGVLSDDEFYAGWFAFQPGVEVRVVMDACFSGSPIRTLLAMSAGTRRTLGAVKAEPQRPLPACSVFSIGAAHDDAKAVFGRLSTFVCEVLQDWWSQSVAGTWADLLPAVTLKYRQNNFKFTTPTTDEIRGTGDAPGMALSKAFYPRD